MEGKKVEAVKFDSALATKLSSFIKLTPDELSVVAELQSNSIKVKRGKELTEEGQANGRAIILCSGWACSYKILSDGARQIITFPIAGDCVGLRSILLRTSDHSLSTVTDATVSTVEADRMLKVLNEHPRVGAALMWATSRDEAMVVEHLVSIGRRSALERTAHFFMELAERLMLVRLATSSEFKCPLNQYVLADALGLSAIHVNRVLRQLRERGLMTVKSGKVVIHDMSGLSALAGYRKMDGSGS